MRTILPGDGPEALVLARELERHRAGLTGHCQRMLGSRFEAEDAVQDTLVRAWLGMSRVQRRAALGAWLHRIATNVCLDMLSGRARRPAPLDIAALAGDEPRAPDEGPAEAALRREAAGEALAAAVGRLTPGQRAALILCEVLRWRAAEAAAHLGTSVAAVNSALQRARAAVGGDAPATEPPALDAGGQRLLARYREALARDDVGALAELARRELAAVPG